MCFDGEVRGRGGSCCMGIWVNRGPMDDGATLLTIKGRDEMRDGSEGNSENPVD